MLLILGFWVLLACKAPQFFAATTGEPAVASSTPRLVESPTSVSPRPTASQTAQESPSASPLAASPTPVFAGPVTTALPETYPVIPIPTRDEQAYPGPATNVGASPTPTSASDTPYPGPGSGVTPSATDVVAVLPSLTPMFTRTPSPTGVTVTTATPPPLPTITPTFTPPPTATQPPVPPPAWVNSELRATDPNSVELASGDIQLIWFFAFWDGPSQAMAPLVHAMEAEYGQRMNFIYLDIDDPLTTALNDELGYRSQPHFFLVDRDGNVLHQWLGYVSFEEFRSAFEAALG